MARARRAMNALVLQCGGPTAVVNTTLAAIVRRWRTGRCGSLLGGRQGLAALTSGEWVPLVASRGGTARDGALTPDGVAARLPGSVAADLDAWLAVLESTPGMALGGGRVRLRGADLDHAVSRLRAAAVDTLFLIGGNGTMAAGRELAGRAAAARVSLRIVAVPKTIDNDIPCTDVCPGFPSAARFLVETVRDVAADVSSMRGYEDVVLIETMGRHAGWLAAATMLARGAPGDAPHLVLLPERRAHADALLASIRQQHEREGICLVVVAEGVRDETGEFLAARCPEHSVERDAAGQVILGRSGGPLPYVASLVRERLGLRCRLVRPDVLQRSSRAHIAPLDPQLAALAGTAAVDLLDGVAPGRPVMVALRQHGDRWHTEPVPLEEVRGERPLSASLQADASALRPLLF